MKSQECERESCTQKISKQTRHKQAKRKQTRRKQREKIATETVEAITKHLEVNIKMLSLTSKYVKKVITRSKIKEIRKTLKILEDQMEQVETFKICIQA